MPIVDQQTVAAFKAFLAGIFGQKRTRSSATVESLLADWGISSIPFTVRSPTPRRSQELGGIFTGREEELETALLTLRGKPRNLFVYGWYGIGKTAFIVQTLHFLKQRDDTLAAYVSLPEESVELSLFALIALARAMPRSKLAQQVLRSMGLGKAPGPIRAEVGIALPPLTVTGRPSEPLPSTKPDFPTVGFDDLLQEALDNHKTVVIAIDDLDKKDPSQAREILRGAQGMLKSDASFILTGHPIGITKDIYTSELGLFDIHINLAPLDELTTLRMLVNYLNSVRPAGNRRTVDDSDAVHPFTPETARVIVQRSFGIPRYLNRLGEGILTRAVQLRAKLIDEDVLREGLRYVDQQVRTGLITPEERYVLELVFERTELSSENITLEELQRLGMREFHEVMPILQTMVQRDLLRRLEDRFTASPLVLPRKDK